MSTNDYSRPSPQTQRLYMPTPNVHFGTPEQQRVGRQRHMEQTDYLNGLAAISSRNMLSTDEIGQKQQFSRKLGSIAERVVQTGTTQGSDMQRYQVRLQPYGSLANSFGTTGCDVDLLLTVERQNGALLEISEDVKRNLEKVLLDQGIGARLLTNTRVPILRVCEKPNPDLLKALREYRTKWELSLLEPESLHNQRGNDDYGPLPSLTESQEDDQRIAMAKLDLNAAEVALPDSPLPDHAKLEYVGDCGIQCDINFSNHVALHNSRMLWTYGQVDPRVRHLGVFVKNWAKARDINTPYRGTLSSYGYILMVLHYLINVARPPVLPNLQEMAKDNGWNQAPPELFEGHDIRFTQDRKTILQERDNMPHNNTSLGGLLLGFFRYYGTPQGFRWTEHVISIRTPGGILAKEQKGWTKAKWSEENSNVRQRYLLALEDPFEINHNVGRTVGHNGIVAIRDEFRRAWDIIDSIQRAAGPQGQSWVWNVRGHNESGDGLDLIRPSEGRGDTLRKDADARKARQMREKLEQQHALAMKNTPRGEQEGEMGEVGMLTARDTHLEVLAPAADNPAQLIHDVQHQDEKVLKMRSRQPERQRHHEDDVEEDDTMVSGAQATGEADDGWQSVTWEEHDVNLGSTNIQICGQKAQQSQNESWNASAPLVETGQRIPEDTANASQSEAQIDGATDLWWNSHQQGTTEQGHDLKAVPDNTENILHDAKIIVQPRSPTYEFEDSLTTCHHAQTLEQSYSPECVGENIEWTTKSKAGLWLLNRDKRIRAGTFKPPTANHEGRLHAKFPYNKLMTKEELAQMNKRLEEQYKDSYYPKLPVQPVRRSSENNKVLVDITADSDSQWQPEGHFTDTLQKLKPADDWPVGSDILWSVNTETGKWLRWRDRRIKDGRWKDDPEDNSLSQKLCRLFPCDSEKTLANIERMNTELDTFFQGLIYPRAGTGDDERRDAVTMMHRAIERLLEHRMTHRGDRQSCPPRVTQSSDELSHDDTAAALGQDLPSWRLKSPEITGMDGADACTVLHKQIYASASNGGASAAPLPMHQAEREVQDMSTPIRWPIATSVGRWLQRRDEGMVDKTWQEAAHENSVFSRLSSLYPHDTAREPAEQDRLNHEIKTYFTGVELPRSGFGNAEPVYGAILKMVGGRKDHAGTDRIKLLLSFFQEDTLKGLREARNNPVVASTPQQRKHMDERSMQAVQALSSQLSANRPSPSADEVADFVRKQRLAFYDRHQPSPSAELVPGMAAAEDAETSVRRDSAAEGSWNDLLSPSKSLNPCAIPFVPMTDTEKPIGTKDVASPPSTPRSGDADLFEPKGQHDPATTDESAGEVVPNTLHPDTWRTNRKHRHEDPRIIPIPRMLDFDFDPRQLADIENIKGGGNGCVRGGQSPYMLESDQHSWGGGGAMAQRSESMQRCWSHHGYSYPDSGVGMEEEIMKTADLLTELPISGDIFTG